MASSHPTHCYDKRFVVYLRVSTAKQERSGLGLEAQRAACERHLATIPGATVVDTFEEADSGKNNGRPKLAAAIALARATGVTVLIAKLDRLSRDAHFLIGLAQEETVPFVALDLPGATKFTWGIMALVAQQERERISKNTKDALAKARDRLAAEGRRLGNPNGAAHLRGLGNKEAIAKVSANADAFAKSIAPMIASIEASGINSTNAIANELNARGVLTARGKLWTATAVVNLKARL